MADSGSLTGGYPLLAYVWRLTVNEKVSWVFAERAWVRSGFDFPREWHRGRLLGLELAEF